MRQRWVLMSIALWLLAWAVGAGAGEPRVFVETATQTVGVGQPLDLVVGVENPTDAPLILTFPSSYQADYTIDKKYMWSDGRAFAMALTRIEIPAGGFHVWSFRHEPKDFALSEGPHEVRARVVADNVALEPVSITVEVTARRQRAMIADLWRSPHFYMGRTLRLFGEYQGQRRGGSPYPPDQLPPGSLAEFPPAEGTDWLLRDETGAAYCENRPATEVRLDLHPEWTHGVRLSVAAQVSYTAEGAPRLLPMLIRHQPGEGGMFCVLEVESPGTSAPDVFLLRMIVKNDTGAPVKLIYPSGQTHDFVIMKDGQEVWRWSRHEGAVGGVTSETLPGRPPGVTDAGFLPQDNSLVYRVLWPQVDDSGKPVPPGAYEAWGVISRRVFTLPVAFEAGRSAEDTQ